MTNPLSAQALADPVAFLPGIHGRDPHARYWLSQVTLRLRREVCWLWRERAQADGGDSALPPPVDSALAALDLLRYEREKRAFFADDITARYLSERIATTAPLEVADAPRGSFGWVARQLELAPVECFVLALALLPGVDSAAGQVIASCLNDPSRTSPNLALAQRLWDEPDELLNCFDPAHPLLRHGLLHSTPPHDWNSALQVPALVARELLFPAGRLPSALLTVSAAPASAALEAAAARVRAALAAPRGLQLLPLLGAAHAPLAETAAACATLAGVQTLQPSAALPREHLAQAFCTAWLRGCALYLPARMLADPTAHDDGLEALRCPACRCWCSSEPMSAAPCADWAKPCQRWRCHPGLPAAPRLLAPALAGCRMRTAAARAGPALPLRAPGHRAGRRRTRGTGPAAQRRRTVRRRARRSRPWCPGPTRRTALCPRRTDAAAGPGRAGR